MFQISTLIILHVPPLHDAGIDLKGSSGMALPCRGLFRKGGLEENIRGNLLFGCCKERHCKTSEGRRPSEQLSKFVEGMLEAFFFIGIGIGNQLRPLMGHAKEGSMGLAYKWRPEGLNK